MSQIIARGSGDQDGPAIGPGCRVTLHFSLLLAGGEEIDTTRRGKPATFEFGDGSLLPGFEDSLVGMRAGDAEQLVLPASSAFGDHNPANVRRMARRGFEGMAGDEELAEGLVVSFRTADGELPGVVIAVYDETVKVDFNHPLSGRDVVFDVSILEVASV